MGRVQDQDDPYNAGSVTNNVVAAVLFIGLPVIMPRTYEVVWYLSPPLLVSHRSSLVGVVRDLRNAGVQKTVYNGVGILWLNH